MLANEWHFQKEQSNYYKKYAKILPWVIKFYPKTNS